MLVDFDKFYKLREGLFGNTEPSVTIETITSTIEERIDPQHLPAWSAAISYGSRHKLTTPEQKERLTRQLKKLQHLTPFEAVTFGLYIKGISKACGAQLSRYRMSGHISASRRFMVQQNKFVYPILANVINEGQAVTCYYKFESMIKRACWQYEQLRDMGISKQDARLIIPVCSSTERVMWVNARSLFHIFDERLKPDAEPEIRRLCILILREVTKVAPLLFEDYNNA